MYAHTEKYRDLEVVRFAGQLIVDRAAGKSIPAVRLTGHDRRELTAVLEDAALWFIWDPCAIGTYGNGTDVYMETVMGWMCTKVLGSSAGRDPQMGRSLRMLTLRCIQDDLAQPDPGIAADIRAMRDELLDLPDPDLIRVVLAHTDLVIAAFGYMDQSDPINDNLSWMLRSNPRLLPHGYPTWDGNPPDLDDEDIDDSGMPEDLDD